MNSRTTKLVVFVAVSFPLFGSAVAGALDPPGAPAPTMVTLQQIYDRVSRGTVALGQTGQTGCWDGAGTPISCAGTSQDGESQDGASASPRFTDNGDGTVKDNLTKLIWLKDAFCFGERTWAQALSDVSSLSNAQCGLTDGSVAGSWRLPNVRELLSLIDYQTMVPSLPAGHPFSGVNSGVERGTFLTSTTVTQYPYWAWIVNFDDGSSVPKPKSEAKGLWPVRRGQ